VNGTVDSGQRALLPIALHNSASGTAVTLDAWIDTGFTGDLSVPRAQIATLKLPEGYSIRATLADGSQVDIKTNVGEIDWFGVRQATEVIASDGAVPLLGTGLLRGHDLEISYRRMTVKLD
jgi:clan AA aspartic protease